MKAEILAQRNFRRKCGREPPARSTIRSWHIKCMETGGVVQEKEAGRLQTLEEEEIVTVRAAYTESLEQEWANILVGGPH